MPVQVSAIQLNSTYDVDRNLASAEKRIREAAEQGAQLIVLPEGLVYIGPESCPHPIAEALPEGGPILERFRKCSRDVRAELILGGFPESSRDGKLFNSCVHISASGDVVSVYRKIHLFDADLPGGAAHRESQRFRAGEAVVVTPTALGLMGLSICYDLRFPELYRLQVDKGAVALAIPSAFTQATGRAHWHVLLRARAIESQAFVIAAAQTGEHYPGRQSFGHSLIVDPWGEVLEELSEGEGVITTAINPDDVSRVREQMPCLRHRKL